eukprot:1920283-Rhodomonas_salina.3
MRKSARKAVPMLAKEVCGGTRCEGCKKRHRSWCRGMLCQTQTRAAWTTRTAQDRNSCRGYV